jgi:hypothetical protein
MDWVKEITLNRKGLQSHGKMSKKHLKEWIDNKDERDLLRKCNIISLDFAG